MSGRNNNDDNNNNPFSSFSQGSVQPPNISASTPSSQNNITALERYFLGDRTPSTGREETPVVVVDFITEPGLTATAASLNDGGISSSTMTPTRILEALLDRGASSVPSRDHSTNTQGGNTNGNGPRSDSGYSRG
ncbi:hypothetical protein C364_06115 [Cryptococcus neoformans Bt63]|nr:hypothetical protein C364_06115 [Cryptococcus neoformans var. grubii Bt63]